MAIFDTHVIVDWSARSKPSPAKPTKDSIWWAAASDGKTSTGYERTRLAAIRCLTALIAGELAAGRRVLVGFDFPFGYPQGVASHLTGKADALAVWAWLAKRIEDGEDNANNRFEVASGVNGRYSGIGPFWGRPAGSPFEAVPIKKKALTERGAHPPEYRVAEVRAKGAKSVWQLYGAGSVGSQVLVGLPALERLRTAPALAGKVAVWPFETGLKVPDKPVVLAEVYPSLLSKEVDRAGDEIKDRAQVRVNAEWFAWLDNEGDLGTLFQGTPMLMAADRRAVSTEEGWILGLV